MSIVNNENIEELWSLLKAYIDEYLVSKNSLPTKMTPTSHASASTTYGVGSSSNYGHVKLSDSTTSTSGVSSGVAATPAAVRSVKEIADEAKTAANKSIIPQYACGTLHFKNAGSYDDTTYKVINFVPSIIKVYYVGTTSATGNAQLCTVLTPPTAYGSSYTKVNTIWDSHTETVDGHIAEVSKGKTYYWRPIGSAGYYVYEIMGYKETT